MRLLFLVVLSCLLLVAASESVSAERGYFSGRIIFFGSRVAADKPQVVRTWSPESDELAEVVALSNEIPVSGRISPDGSLLAVSFLKREDRESSELYTLELINSEGNRRILAEDVYVVAWSPDSEKILCRRGKKYEWSHFLVDIQDGQETALPIERKDTVMDWSPDGDTLCVMKGRPDSLWKRGPDDFYPKRQLYFVSLTGKKAENPFTSSEEDCIWWQFSPSGERGVYYRRHYATGRPIETAMMADADGGNVTQLVDFTKLGVRPSGSRCWSPDEKEIIWAVTREAEEDNFDYELMFIPTEGGRPRLVTAAELGLVFFGKLDWR